ncbi:MULTISPECIES: hypothetical protein [unclassified Geobacillus]|uniref:hypothetical protein n=1 Tax=unclassified Geobacillus TaxID=2642459 RepID=UPI001E4A3E1F|nr:MULTISPECIES: hypothetical protein [unclassified Geobacillus]
MNEYGDSTFVGAVADWLDSLGKFNGGLTVAKGLLAVHVLGTGLLTLAKDAKGNFIIKTSPAWVKGANKKYESKLAERIYQLLEKGDIYHEKWTSTFSSQTTIKLTSK